MEDSRMAGHKRNVGGARKGLHENKENPNEKSKAAKRQAQEPEGPAAAVVAATNKRVGLSLREGPAASSSFASLRGQKTSRGGGKKLLAAAAAAPAAVAEPKEEEKDDMTSGVVSMETESMDVTSGGGERIEDIDAWDRDDPQQVTEYVDEIFQFFYDKELIDRPNPEYMTELQSDIKERMRGILVDWMASVATKFGLLSETLFLSVYILDRFLSLKKVSRHKLQLVGVAAMLVASKYEEIFSPLIEDFEWISAKNCQRADILRVEKIILTTLEFNLTTPSPLHFLRRFSKAARSDSETHTLSKFLIELSLPSLNMLRFKPSMIAASAVLLARKMKGASPVWNGTLAHYTKLEAAELLECAQALNQLVAEPATEKSHYKAIKQKYANQNLFSVSELPAVPQHLFFI